ncbi:DNA mismatch repair endonuclease MutL [Halobaculum sp. MBLA0143]|uniref:DNA mismatch repair endonuclease MutL n=1 Tax=Halobaculum sp. MBLA0143 TaxID=3079933 RepID=UPI003524E1B9
MSERDPVEITPLDDRTVREIAAGEVVERPASVVKELVENSLDAGASRVAVSVADGGQESIRVRDDGHGIARDQLRRAVAEHATSKLDGIGELDAGVGSLGFRGEALYTVGAVSRLTVRSRPSGAETGAEVVVDHGDTGEVTPAGCPTGTVVTVRELFGETPARRKFLKTAATEFDRVNAVVSAYALANPGVAVSLEHDDREVFATPGDGDRRSAVLSVYGREVAESMLSVSGARSVTVAGTDAEVRVTGLVSEPETTRASRSYVTTFVDGRWIRDGQLRRAVVDAYDGQLAADRYPFAVLSVSVPPAAVDVNVHPRKTEVRFDDDAAVVETVRETVREGLLSAGLLRTSAPRGRSAPEETELDPAVLGGAGHGPTPGEGDDTSDASPSDTDDATPTGTDDASPSEDSDTASGPTDADTDTDTDAAAETDTPRDDTTDDSMGAADDETATTTDEVLSAWGATESEDDADPADGNEAGTTDARGPADGNETGTTDTGDPADDSGDPASPHDPHDDESAATASEAATAGDAPTPRDWQASAAGQRTLDGGRTDDWRDHDSLPSLRVLGQYDDTYVVCETAAGLVLVDQHAADERVNYERLRRAAGLADGDDPAVQALAEPVTVSVTAREAALFDAFREALTAAGFRAESVDDPSADRAVAVTAVPAVFDAALDPELLRDTLVSFAEDVATHDRPTADAADDLLADLACYPSITGATSLTEGSVAALLSALDECENPYACPHGRPVLVRFDATEIDDRFERDYPGHDDRRER